jgi:hypothetical protein
MHRYGGKDKSLKISYNKIGLTNCSCQLLLCEYAEQRLALTGACYVDLPLIAPHSGSKMPLEKPTFPPGADSEQYARSLDAEDHLRSFRDKFIIPSKTNIKTKKLEKPGLFRSLLQTGLQISDIPRSL